MSRLARILALLGLLTAFAGVAEARVDPDRAALKALAGSQADATGAARLPLGAGVAARPSSAARAADLRVLATRTEPARVLISVRSHAAVDGVARAARALGTRVRVFRAAAVVSVTAPPAAVVRRLARDPRVESIEPNRVRRISVDPADDVDPETGIPFGWAFDAVNAAGALRAVGGGSQRVVAVIDSGADVTHPDIAGQIAGTFNSNDGSPDVTDRVGHGTFVIGLISMQHDNAIGGKGAGGSTRVLAIRADNGFGEFSTESLLVAKEAAIASGADILNMSLGGDTLTEVEARSLEFAFLQDVLPVAAAGNGAQRGNPVEFPAAAVGGFRGAVGIGLSVGATKPDGTPGDFSTHNNFVSVAAPGSAQGGCEKGVFSTVPANPNLIFDDPQSCSDVYSQGGGGRYGYSEGTSFATPLVSAVAALTWQAERRLQSEQVADVVQRSARQTFRSGGWNEFTGHGVVDGEAAVALARRYDVVSPSFKTAKKRIGRRIELFVGKGRDRTQRGDELAGGLTYSLAQRLPDGNVRFVVAPRRKQIRRRVADRPGRYVGLACDANGNCATKTIVIR